MALDRVYELAINGIDFTDAIEISVPKLDLEATLQPGTPFHLTVRISKDESPAGQARADKLASDLHQRLLLRFAADIERSDKPRITRTSFRRVGTLTVPSPNIEILSAVARKPRPKPRIATANEIDVLKREVEIRASTPQPSTSAQLYTAIEMYAFALQSENRVVRFLVLYTALSVAVLYRQKAKKVTQNKVDNLLREKCSGLPEFSAPNGQMETIYTHLRNNLLHAEDRGYAPAKAIKEIESKANQFQKDVAWVLLAL